MLFHGLRFLNHGLCCIIVHDLFGNQGQPRAAGENRHTARDSARFASCRSAADAFRKTLGGGALSQGAKAARTNSRVALSLFDAVSHAGISAQALLAAGAHIGFKSSLALGGPDALVGQISTGCCSQRYRSFHFFGCNHFCDCNYSCGCRRRSKPRARLEGRHTVFDSARFARCRSAGDALEPTLGSGALSQGAKAARTNSRVALSLFDAVSHAGISAQALLAAGAHIGFKSSLALGGPDALVGQISTGCCSQRYRSFHFFWMQPFL